MNDFNESTPGSPPRDELDALLREWHEENAQRAALNCDKLMESIRREGTPGEQPTDTVSVTDRRGGVDWRCIVRRSTTIAAVIALFAVIVPFLLPTETSAPVFGSEITYLPDGGRLDAIDADGAVIGPCALRHTDVDVEISGHFTRVTVTQQYYNPYDDKIEAVYTFPLSHRAAVDRMNMTVGNRTIVGEVHERSVARAIYESARERGYVASLLEQERPNIFTQNVANIEPGAQIDIEISYVETLQSKDGTYTFDFPMVVEPRYIPGAPTGPSPLPKDVAERRGIILWGPCQIQLGDVGDTDALGELSSSQLNDLLRHATPISVPSNEWRGETEPKVWYQFATEYTNGSKERGVLYTNRIGQLNGRWFCVRTPPKPAIEPGSNFSPPTGQVPDANRITPMPVRPEQRAGHDISIDVTIDTGGPGIVDLKSSLHKIVSDSNVERRDGTSRKMSVSLKKASEIPNRDFVLNWRQTADKIEEATFTHTGKNGNFFTLILQPPERVEENQAAARELVFVLDVSGSMRGYPIEKAKETMARLIDTMRPQDTFNLITFSGDTRILWPDPRPATKTNVAEAQQFLASRKGSGGTEMMKVINAALVQKVGGQPKGITPDDLANLPADGREMVVVCGRDRIVAWPPANVRSTWGGLAIQPTAGEPFEVIIMGLPDEKTGQLQLTGQWETRAGRRVLSVQRWEWLGAESARPLRICCFMTDGMVGNDMAIIDAVKQNADTTRVFSFGIGNSTNRYLLDNMALAGGGAVDYVLLNDKVDEKVDRFVKRIQTPVLTHVDLQFGGGLEVTEIIPKRIPDLWDVQPLVIHGKYTQPGKGTLTIRGNTGTGRYERNIELMLPESQPEHDTIATLWARAKVKELMDRDLAAAQRGQLPTELRNEIIRLGEQHSIMTQFTSFVAVEKARVTIGGQPRLVHIPIEFPDGVSWEGIFGGPCDSKALCRVLTERRIPALFGKALEYREKKEYDKAGKTLKELLAIEPNHDQARHMLDVLEDTSLVRGQAGDGTGGVDGIRRSVRENDKTKRRIASASPPIGTSGAKPSDEAAHARQKEVKVTGIVSELTASPEGKWNDGDVIVGGNGTDVISLGELNNEGQTLSVVGGSEGGSAGRSVILSTDPNAAVTNTELSRSESVRTDGRLGDIKAYLADSSDGGDQGGVMGGMGMMGGMGGSYGGYGGGMMGGGAGDGYSGGMGGYGDGYGRASSNRYSYYDFAGTGSASGENYSTDLALKQHREGIDGSEQAAVTWSTSLEVPAAASAAGKAPEDRLYGVQNLVSDLELRNAGTTTQPAQAGQEQTVRGLHHLSPALLCDYTALSIANEVKAGRIEDAKKLADTLVSYDQKYETGVKMRDVLADESLAVADRDKRIAALAEEAQERIDGFLRNVKLQKRLDPQLYQCIADKTTPAEIESAVVDDGVRVTMLLNEFTDKKVASLHKAGLRVEDTAPSLKMVVGVVPLDKLADVTMVDGIEKVEPTLLR